MAETLVVDASVLLKWQFSDEDLVTQSLQLRQDYLDKDIIKLVAPTLLIYELINGIVVASRKNRILPNRAVEVLHNFLVADIELLEIEPYRVIELCQEYNIAAYDAAYLALAESLECDLWTGDKAFYSAVKDESTRVKWIGFYTPTA